MRIMHIVPALAIGGGERAAINLANEQSRRGHHVTIVSAIASAASPLRTTVSNDVDVIDASAGSGRWAKYFALIKWWSSNRDLVASFDVIHAHLSVASCVATLMFAHFRLAGGARPTIVETYHAVGMPVSPLLRSFHYLMLRWRDGVVFMAEDRHSREFGNRTGSPRQAFILNGEVIACSPTVPQVDAYRDELGIPRDVVVVGTVGRLVRERRPDLFIEIFERIHRQHAGTAHFLFVGDGDVRPEIEELARSVGQGDQLHFPGAAIEPITPMSAMSVYLTLMVGNVSGMAGVQAALAGVAVVGLQLDPGFVPSGSDWIWSDVDPGRVARKIGELIVDEGARRAIAADQQEYARRQYSIERTADSYEAFLGTIMNSGKALATCVG